MALGALVAGAASGTLACGETEASHAESGSAALQSAPLAPENTTVQPLRAPSLVVVHASATFDTDAIAKPYIDQLVSRFGQKKLPTVYLVNDVSPEGENNWYTANRQPSYLVFSEGGEHNLPIVNPDVTLVGGFFGTSDEHRGCYATALRNVVNSYFHWQKGKGPLTIHLPVRGIYFYEEDLASRATFLSGGAGTAWVKSIRPILFSSDFNDDGERELGAPFLRDLKGETGPNPFFDKSAPAPAFPETEPAPRRDPATGLLETEDGRYEEGPRVGVRDYTFEIRVDGRGIETVGTGPKRVLLSFER